MPVVSYPQFNKSITVPEGVTVLEASRRAQVIIESPCNGSGTCKKCKAKIGRKNDLNADIKYSDVLSCEAIVSENLWVTLPEQKSKNNSLKIIETGFSFKCELNPNISKKYNLTNDTTEVSIGKNGYHIETGNTTNKIFGCVIDIGTTTLVATLVDLITGKELASSSALNPQSIHAHDVLSRISMASEENGLKVLYELIANEIDNMIASCAKKAAVATEYIYEVVYSGNTCMLYLATNNNPKSIGVFPYITTLTGNQYCKSTSIGVQIKKAFVYLPPVISAYVGADITSGILATSLYEMDGTILLIDVGTNGEMVLSVNGKMTATSTAAGPAFEGMTIKNGMRANDGAIERFSVDDEGEISIQTIGNQKAIGICGSGLIDSIGELVRTGVILKSGRIADSMSHGLREKLAQRIEKVDKKSLFRINENVVLVQKDIRQVQLAKAAIRTGIDFLLQVSGVFPDKVDKVYIAGSFGYHLKEDALLNTGMIPREFTGKLDFIGNTSLSGGKAFLVNAKTRDLLSKIVKNVNSIDLARLDGFQNAFVKNIEF